MGNIKDAPQATEAELSITNHLIEKLKKQISYFELIISKKDTFLSFNQIRETLKYINNEKLSQEEMKHIVEFVNKFTFENTKEESLATQLKFTFQSYKSRAMISQNHIKQQLKQFKDIIKLNDAYLLETTAYNIADKKEYNRTLFDFLEN